MNKTLLIGLAVVVLLAGPAVGDTKWTLTGGGEGKWETGGNWDAGTPDAADVAYITYAADAAAVVIDDTTGIADSGVTCLGYSGGGVLRQRGGTLTASGGSYGWSGIIGAFGVGLYDHSGGTHNATGGQLYLGGTGGTTGTYNLSGTGVLNAGIVEVGTNWYSGTSDGYFNISGGTVGATSVTLGTAGGTTDAILKVTGSWGAGTDKITFGTYTQTDMGTLVAEINGIETIVVTGAAAFDGNLVITDLGAAAGEYTIMTYASQTGAFTVTLPGNGLWENPVYGDTALTVTKVPEPMTMTLLGLGGIGVLLRRKRR